MSIVINMSSYEIERDSMENEYGEEAARAGWNPELALACRQQQLAPCNRQAAMPTDLAAVDVELFMEKMYAFQR